MNSPVVWTMLTSDRPAARLDELHPSPTWITMKSPPDFEREHLSYCFPPPLKAWEAPPLLCPGTMNIRLRSIARTMCVDLENSG